jgi:integrase
VTVYVRPYRGSATVLEYHVKTIADDGTPIEERRKSPRKTEKETLKHAEKRERTLLKEHDDRVEAAAKAGKVEPPKKRTPTFAEYVPVYLEWCVAQRMSGATMKIKRHVMEEFVLVALPHVHLDELSEDDIARFMTMLTEFAPVTAATRFDQFRALLKRAIDAKVITHIPVKLTRPKVPKSEAAHYRGREMDSLLRASGDETRVAALLGSDAALRVGEMLGLEVRHLDFERREVHVLQAVWEGKLKPTKGNRSRVVPMSDSLALALAEYLLTKPWLRGGDRLLVRASGKPANPDDVRRWIREAEAAAGLPVVGHSHQLRHTCLTELVHGGAPLPVAQAIAGHADIVTTARYLHLRDGDKEAALRALEAARAARAAQPAASPETAPAETFHAGLRALVASAAAAAAVARNTGEAIRETLN